MTRNWKLCPHIYSINRALAPLPLQYEYAPVTEASGYWGVFVESVLVVGGGGEKAESADHPRGPDPSEACPGGCRGIVDTGTSYLGIPESTFAALIQRIAVGQKCDVRDSVPYCLCRSDGGEDGRGSPTNDGTKDVSGWAVAAWSKCVWVFLLVQIMRGRSHICSVP